MKLPVYLYTNLFEVILDLDDNNRINQVMYQRDLKLQKGLKNTVQLQFKNSDQKLVDIRSKQFVFVLFDAENQRNLVEKDVRILDTSTSTTSTSLLKGLGEVSFTESDLNSCESVYYTAVIKALDEDGSYVPTYANTYYGVGGTIEVRHDVYPVLVPSQEVVDFRVYYNADQDARRYEYYTGDLNAHPEYSSNVALHTAAVYMTNYKGSVIIEGTLENTPMDFGNYAVISTKTYNGFTGIDYTNFNGIFSKVRVRYIPAKEPTSQENNDTNYAGTVDKVLYRS